jgi:hypothetical protein
VAARIGEELVFDLSLDSLSEQADVLKDVRTRSATLRSPLRRSSRPSSGGRAIDAVGLNAVTGGGVVSFVLTLLPPIYLVTATGEARFSIEGARLYSDLAPAKASLGDAYLAFAERLYAARQRNRPLVARALWSLRLGFGALIIEVILFLVAAALH